jgi:hypothetical protein
LAGLQRASRLQVITLWCTLIGCLSFLSLATTRRYYSLHIEDAKEEAAAEAEAARQASEEIAAEAVTAVAGAVKALDAAPSADKLDALIALMTAWAAETREWQLSTAAARQLDVQDTAAGTSARGIAQAPQAPRRVPRAPAAAVSQPSQPPQREASGAASFCMPFMSLSSGGVMAPARRPHMDTRL